MGKYYVAGIPFDSENCLMHYGVKNMEWGKHKFGIDADDRYIKWLKNAGQNIGKFANNVGQGVSNAATTAARTVGSAVNKGANFVTGNQARQNVNAAEDRYNQARAARILSNPARNDAVNERVAASNYRNTANRLDKEVKQLEQKPDVNYVPPYPKNLRDQFAEDARDHQRKADDSARLNNQVQREQKQDERQAYNDMLKAQKQYSTGTIPGIAANAANAVGDWAGQTAQNVGQAAGNAVNAVGDFYNNSIFGKTDRAALEAAKAAGQWIGDRASDVGTEVQSLTNTPEFRDAAAGVNNAIDAVGNAAQNVGNGAKGFINSAGKWVSDTAGNVGKGVSNAAQNVGKGAKGFINSAGQWVSTAANDVGNAVGNAANDVKNFAGQTAQNVGNAVSGAAEQARGGIGGLFDRVGNAVTNAGNAVGDWAGNTAKNVGNAVTNAGNAVGDWGRNAVQDVGQAVTNAGNAVGDWGRNAAQNVGQAAGNAANAVGDFYNNSFLGKTDRAALEAAKAAGQWIGDRAQDVGQTAGNVVNAVGNGIQNAGQAIANTPKNVENWYTGQPNADRAEAIDRQVQEYERLGDMMYDRGMKNEGDRYHQSAANLGRVADANQARYDTAPRQRLNNAIDAVGDWAGNAAQNVGGAVSNAANTAGQWVGNAAQNVGQAAVNAGNWIGDRASDAASYLNELREAPLKAQLNNAFTGVMDNRRAYLESHPEDIMSPYHAQYLEESVKNDPEIRALARAMAEQGMFNKNGSSNTTTWDNAPIQTYENTIPENIIPEQIIPEKIIRERVIHSDILNTATANNKPDGVSDAFWAKYTADGGTREEYERNWR